MRSFLGPLTVLFVVGACEPQDVALESLTKPSVSWEQRRGLCTRVRAVDAAGALWDDTGCEGDAVTLERVTVLSAERVTELKTATDAMTRVTPLDDRCDGASRHLFTLRQDNATPSIAWTRCGSGTAYGQLDGLTEPFLTIARILNQ
jgi:hypothetical protein